jgi:hypothetical protein
MIEAVEDMNQYVHTYILTTSSLSSCLTSSDLVRAHLVRGEQVVMVNAPDDHANANVNVNVILIETDLVNDQSMTMMMMMILRLNLIVCLIVCLMENVSVNVNDGEKVSEIVIFVLMTKMKTLP